MKRRVYWVTMAAACLALAASTGVALAGNPHGTPPGQEKKADTSSSSSSTSSSSSATSSSATSSQTQTAAPNPQSKYAGCSASDSQGAGVKPNNTTKHNTCATADSKQTKLYGNAKTAGGIAMSRGAPGSTMIYGPGNSQPHKVATCPDKHGKVHYKDVHAVKSYPANGCGSSSTSTSSTSNTSNTSNSTSSSSNTSNTSSSTAGTAATSSGTPAAQSGVLGARATVKAPAKAAAPRSGVLGASARTGTLPFTGLPLWIPALAAVGLLGAGAALRRRAGSAL